MIDWEFIYILGVLATIWFGSITGFSSKVNRSFSTEAATLFEEIRKHNEPIDEKTFKKWMDDYYSIKKPKDNLNILFKVGLLLMVLLFLGSFHTYIPDDLKELEVMVYAIILYSAIIFGIAFVSVTWWYKESE